MATHPVSRVQKKVLMVAAIVALSVTGCSKASTESPKVEQGSKGCVVVPFEADAGWQYDGDTWTDGDRVVGHAVEEDSVICAD